MGEKLYQLVTGWKDSPDWFVHKGMTTWQIGKKEHAEKVCTELNTLTADLATVKKVMTQKNDMFRDGWDELKAENARLREALKEVLTWIDNWSPNFEDDPEWPETLEKVTTALNGGDDDK